MNFFILAIPWFLIPTTAGIFVLAGHLLGSQGGYLFGFGFYWLFWCLLIPGVLSGKAKMTAIFRERTPLFSRSNWLAALLWIAIMLIAVMMYAGDFVRAPIILILFAVPLATINGFCEEILWRGIYVKAFPNNPWLAIFYPSVGFAGWHFVPQLLYPADNSLGFVVSTFFLALPYGYIAYRTGSAKWTALSHSLSGVLVLGGFLAPSLLEVLGIF
uniref:CPBP family intramembrane metalloprotease n=1 Tax=Bellilinea caldifistulae TaxID=360411 RepID=A0A7C4KYJ5_9CHLR